MGWEIWYQLDQKSITKEHCINKSRPKLNCNGKCYLAKQLKKIELEESKNTTRDKHNPFAQKVESQFISTFKIDQIYSCEFISKNEKSNFIFKDSILFSINKPIFHPPCIV